ncbi:winged helix-turn-helix transcriptional regulator [Latilactobacillus curvatus]
MIIYQPLQHSNLHFGDLTRALPDCSRRMLALQLEELIADHVITKTVISLRPLKTEYQLSEFGQTLSPVINAMATWELIIIRLHNRMLDTVICSNA